MACYHCNRRKSNRISAIDELLNKETPLFNPRTQLWREHFIWSENKLLIIGLTDTGRVTVTALAFNRDKVINIRATDLAIKRHPPIDDPIQLKYNKIEYKGFSYAINKFTQRGRPILF